MIEEKFMRRAIDLALHAEALSVSPNPRVGAVLVYEGRVIGEGYHQHVGEGHAEVNCLANVKPSDRPLISKSTMYVTLEPCAHEGRTPSCARRLVAEQVKRVVIGTQDPHPKVSGGGIDILRNGGIEVVVPFMEEECREVAKVFMTNQIYHRPYITLKWAESADGFLDTRRDSHSVPPAKLSSPFTRMLVHHLRSMCAGILVGRRTLELDHPSLTNRDWIISPNNPRRILLSSTDTLPEGWEGLSDVNADEMKRLLDQGITSLLVEGGANTHRAFMEAGLWDEIHREVAPLVLGDGVCAPRIPDGSTLVECSIIDERCLETWRRDA